MEGLRRIEPCQLLGRRVDEITSACPSDLQQGGRGSSLDLLLAAFALLLHFRKINLCAD